LYKFKKLIYLKLLYKLINIIYIMENENSESQNEYIKTLKPIELIALNIAKQNLETSFCLEKSIGFLNYLKNINDEKK
jgi:hypothetical protein